MYISKIKISNFRNFTNAVVEFTPGLNVIIGHNNAGKTNLIKALQFVFDREFRGKPTIDDFNKEYKDFSKPPRIDIEITISEHNDNENDKIVVYDWLINESPQYEAQLTYTFYLPSKHWEQYKTEVDQGFHILRIN
jgi:predicted ATP-dependent endonuclease of OLD family